MFWVWFEYRCDRACGCSWKYVGGVGVCCYCSVSGCGEESG